MHPVIEKLNQLGVECSLVDVVTGPQVIRVEVKPEGKSKMHDYRKLSRADDLAFALGAQRVRILAPVPGKSVVAVEYDRPDRQTVRLEDLPDAHYPLCVPLGLDTDNEPVTLILGDAPHCLVAGATGSGKSTCLNSILCALLRAHSPKEMRLCLIDPKRVELTAYEGVPHLVGPIADDAGLAIRQIYGLLDNMEDRFELLHALNARDLAEGNDALEYNGYDPLPYIVVVIDELAELIMLSRKEVESLLVRLAQKGRAAGIHLILATQSPRHEIFTGLLSANIPTRVGFSVAKQVDSRVIMDTGGCETLLGKGDGLLSFAGLPPVRFQGAYCTQDEIADAVTRWRKEAATC